MAAAREISLAELVRNGLEYMLRVSAGAEADPDALTLPEPVALGETDPFADPGWRMRLHSRDFDGCGFTRVFDPCLPVA